MINKWTVWIQYDRADVFEFQQIIYIVWFVDVLTLVLIRDNRQSLWKCSHDNWLLYQAGKSMNASRMKSGYHVLQCALWLN